MCEDPLWSTGQDAQLLNGRSAVQIWCSANAFELKDLNKKIRKPLLPAKAVDPQPANVPLNNCLQLISQLACLRCKDLDRQPKFILTDLVGLAINFLVRSRA